MAPPADGALMESLNTKIFYLKKKVVFPHCTMTVTLTLSEYSHALSVGEIILACPVRTIMDIALPFRRIATLAEVMEINEEKNAVTLQLKGTARARIRRIRKLNRADYEIVVPQIQDAGELKDRLRKKSQELIFLINVDESDKLITMLNYLVEIHQLSDFVANYFVLDFRQRYRIFVESDLAKRGRLLIKILDLLIGRMKKRRERETS